MRRLSRAQQEVRTVIGRIRETFRMVAGTIAHIWA